MPSRMVPRVLAPPLINFGSVPFSGVIVLVLVYEVCIAVHLKVVTVAGLSLTRIVNPVVVCPACKMYFPAATVVAVPTGWMLTP
jgi:hypothetical protein